MTYGHINMMIISHVYICTTLLSYNDFFLLPRIYCLCITFGLVCDNDVEILYVMAPTYYNVFYRLR